jgi:hypothetical protein
MYSYDCLLAAVLLTAPIASDDLGPQLELIRPTLMQLAIDTEILDPREESLLLGMSKDAAGDYQVLRQRYEALLSAPRADEAERFPDRRVVEDFLAFNRAFRKELQAYLDMNPDTSEEVRTAVEELDAMHHLWSAVRDFRCRFYYVTVRRQALAEVRELVGAEAFYRGQLPPHVPLWCFPRLQ